MALYDSENNKLLDTNDNVLLARSTFTIGTQEANKVFVGENEVKAIYIGDNLVYEKIETLPQLSAPTISLDGDILSIEEVANAEYYDIYVDDVLEEVVPAVEPKLYSITYNITNGNVSETGDIPLPSSMEADDAYTFYFEPNSGYYIDSTAIIVTNATYNILFEEGESKPILQIINPTGDVTITITYASKSGATSYSVTANCTNCSYHGSSTIYENELFNFAIYYTDEIEWECTENTITNATPVDNWSEPWTEEIGYACDYYLIKNPTGNVTLTFEYQFIGPDEPEPEEEFEEEEE